MKKLFILLIAITAALATSAQDKAGKKDTTKATALYACPMHADVVSSKPGKCPKCGKDLVLSKKEQMKMEVVKVYTCSMHPDVTSSKPGKCPKCGMDLVEKKKKS